MWGRGAGLPQNVIIVVVVVIIVVDRPSPSPITAYPPARLQVPRRRVVGGHPLRRHLFLLVEFR